MREKEEKKVMIVTALPSMIESSPIHRCPFLLSARFCFQFVFKRQLLVSLWRVNGGETLLKQSYLWASLLNMGIVFKVSFGVNGVSCLGTIGALDCNEVNLILLIPF